MLIYASKLIGTRILSVQTSSAIGIITKPIVNPDNLKIIAFEIDCPLTNRTGNNILDVNSIREYSNYGIVIDDVEELITKDDVVKIADIIKLNFDLIDLKVETKKKSKLGKIIDYTVTSEDFVVQQLIVKRPTLKSFIDPELTINRKEIVEIDDYKVVVKDEEKVIKEKSENEDFIPNFVNPFRKSEQDYAPADSQNPAGKDN